jgi:hypothetical protein
MYAGAQTPDSSSTVVDGPQAIALLWGFIATRQLVLWSKLFCASALTSLTVVWHDGATNSGVSMTPTQRVAFIGNSLPRRCGIATFTTDLQQAIEAAAGSSDTAIVAMTDEGRQYDYPLAVRFQVHENALDEYKSAADF